jgi:hypothetical protein
MNLYTSNYNRCGYNPLAIGISYIVPDWFTGRTVGSFAPTKEMLAQYRAGTLTKQGYIDWYTFNLNQSRDAFKQNIPKLPDGSIFLCYEEPDEFCHRHILADWIQKNCGIFVTEWKTEEELKVEEQNKVVDSIIDF